MIEWSKIQNYETSLKTILQAAIRLRYFIQTTLHPVKERFQCGQVADFVGDRLNDGTRCCGVSSSQNLLPCASIINTWTSVIKLLFPVKTEKTSWSTSCWFLRFGWSLQNWPSLEQLICVSSILWPGEFWTIMISLSELSTKPPSKYCLAQLLFFPALPVLCTSLTARFTRFKMFYCLPYIGVEE